jgi:coiled-coil domain-containing protein 63/114
LRDQIDSLRRERVVFDNIYKKLENEFEQKKKEMVRMNLGEEEGDGEGRIMENEFEQKKEMVREEN